MVLCQKSNQAGHTSSFESDSCTETVKNNSNPTFSTSFQFSVEDATVERVKLRFYVVDGDAVVDGNENTLQEQQIYGKKGLDSTP